MDLYNASIKHIQEKFGSAAPKSYPYSPAKAWPETSSFELVMQKDTAIELGGSGCPSVNITCVTSRSSIVDKDEVLVYGPDLTELKSNVAFARITLLRVGDIESDDSDDTEQAFRTIQELDFTKYHVYPCGYMIRSSAESNREQVRISKDAIRSGISFERIGNTFIRHYKENENVLNAKVIFLTAPDADYRGLIKDAKSVHDITMTLTSILEGLSTDCTKCSLKPICDEVEGMKELHFGKGSQGVANK